MKNGNFIEGNIWKYGDNINTDVIVAPRHHPKEMKGEDIQQAARYALHDLDPTFAGKISRGDILLVGENFGCGSSRECAVTIFQAAGISAIIAKSIANIFFRNAINNGMPVFTCAKAYEEISEGDRVRIDTKTRTIKNLTTGREYQSDPLPDLLMEIVEAGGIVNYTKKKYNL
jgi:3-isopropylmalate/(R)-2-methylmalate dehydratase small subunit